MTYQTIKLIHMCAAALTIVGFISRAVLRIVDYSFSRFISKILPHIIDTLLFVTGITLLMVGHFYPSTYPWMALKLSLVCLYIIVGHWVLKRAKKRAHIVMGLLLCLLLLGYIVLLAHFKRVII